MSPWLLGLALALGLAGAAAAGAREARGAAGATGRKPYCRSYGGCYPRSPAPRPQPEYPYLPAPPGKTPRCAKPGATFCETADHYPARLVQYLIDRWAYDFNTLLKSEDPEEFNFRYPVTYGPYGPSNNALLEGNGTGYSYRPAQTYGPPPHPGYPDRRYRLDVSQTSITYPPPPAPHHQQQVSINPTGPAAGPAEWARFRRDATRRRTKRQASGSGATTLCPTSSSFVAPQAALNTQGNWMFVANVPDQPADRQQRYTQFVRAETCVSSECNGLCSLPNGYTSRCEQQFVQKRLVALGGGGDRLYTDNFWFPHCCVCQISAPQGG
ncbi:protein spaetzle 5 [Frankliniella occidentalis]|uniref:Protein spaetzle 5 n=1 Tax=Frankliniella occidentalis TaxID=133901 RepID=A0A9C6U0J0_FRAOC|nr:protein spaetzle 5 [Frankliniella occidentalis]